MSDNHLSQGLAARIDRLERIEQIRLRVMTFSFYCDNGGPAGQSYDPEGLDGMWVDDAYLNMDPQGYDGRVAIRELNEDLAATFTFHFFVPYEIVPSDDGQSGLGLWYGWEAPILTGQAVFGAFTHQHVYVRAGKEWKWREWRQRVRFFSPFTQGWVDGPRALEQRRSHGA
jgi:hypothetical protein